METSRIGSEGKRLKWRLDNCTTKQEVMNVFREEINTALAFDDRWLQRWIEVVHGELIIHEAKKVFNG